MNCFLIILFIQIFNLLQLLILSTDCYDIIETDKEQSSVTDYIFFLHYTGKYRLDVASQTTLYTPSVYLKCVISKAPTVNNYTRISYNHALSIEDQTNFNPKRETVFYFPGYSEQPSKHIQSVNTIVDAFLTRGDANIVVLDYYELVKGGAITTYLGAFVNATKIGEAVGIFFTYYIPEIQSIDYIHLVGHSLGSQVMSNCAKKYGEGLFKWLTGLDPAGPLFNIPTIQHLSKKDAEFVDIIHTDSFGFGDGRSIGHVDFFPNKGFRIQPYCVQNNYSEFCSHHMSWRYYAESIVYPFNFPAKLCKMNIYCLLFDIRLCCHPNASVELMGYGVNHSARGEYALRTSNKSLFGLGDAGFYV